MNSRALVGLTVAAGCLALGGGFLGCGSSGGGGGPTPDAGPDSTTTDSGGGVDSAAGDTGTGGGDTGTGGGDAGDSGVTDSSVSGDGPSDTGPGFVWDGSMALDCTNYCGFLMATCTGADQQYLNVDECLNACSLLPLGSATDRTGNSIGCRMYHTGLATTQKNPHCWHAGPFGFGACGANCDNFCALATSWCTAADGFEGGTPPYMNLGDCKSNMNCPSFALADGGGDPGAYSAAGPTSGNTLDCREWHLGAALVDHTAQQTHCYHVGAMAIAGQPFPCQ